MNDPVQPPADAAPRPVRRAIFASGAPVALEEVGALARETLGERVTVELRDLLVSGRLAPGEKLSLRRVAEALGVSMMPVREAVNRLAADHALEVLPGRAVRVPILTLAQFRELTRIRLVVEGFAAAQATFGADEERIAVIAGHEKKFREAAASAPPDLGGAVAANRDLHFALYEAAGMPMLVETIERLWLKAGPILNLDMRAEARRLDRGSAVLMHAEIVRALKARDPDAVRAALESDIRQAADHIEATGRLPQ